MGSIGKKKRSAAMGAAASGMASGANPPADRKRGPKPKAKQIGTNGCGAMQVSGIKKLALFWQLAVINGQG